MTEREPRRLLVTAFAPFAPPGGTLRPSNASEEILKAFAARHVGLVDPVVLPVGPRSEVLLARALNRDPVGVVALGETAADGDWDSNVEVRAYDRPLLATPPAPDVRTTSAVSDLALRLPLLPGMAREDRIGSFWCNRVYFRVLQWCIRFERPGLFLHVRVGGDRNRQRRHLGHALQAVELEYCAQPTA